MRNIQTRVITGMGMPNGWHYLQPFKGTFTKIESGSYEELLTAVQTFRLNNGIRIGDIQADVDQYICFTYPRHCRAVNQARNAAATSVPSGTAVRFVDKLTQWALQMRKDLPEFVNMAEAERRATICASCPENINWEPSGCSRCAADANRLFLVTRNGKDTRFKHKLKGCRLHDHDNRTAVWMNLKTQKHPKAPKSCWL